MGSYYYLASEWLRRGSRYKYSERAAVAVGGAVEQELRPLVDKRIYDQYRFIMKKDGDIYLLDSANSLIVYW